MSDPGYFSVKQSVFIYGAVFFIGILATIYKGVLWGAFLGCFVYALWLTFTEK